MCDQSYARGALELYTIRRGNEIPLWAEVVEGIAELAGIDFDEAEEMLGQSVLNDEVEVHAINTPLHGGTVPFFVAMSERSEVDT